MRKLNVSDDYYSRIKNLLSLYFVALSSLPLYFMFTHGNIRNSNFLITS